MSNTTPRRTALDLAHEATDLAQRARSTEYEVLGEADLQTEKPLSDYAVVVVYRDPSNGRLWVRPRDEFNDGRFEEVASDAG